MNYIKKIAYVCALLFMTGAALGMDIFQAAFTGNIGRIEELLANGADVNQQDNEGWTPLHYAVLYGHEAVVLRLIRAGADIDRKENAGGCTALHFAAISGYGEISLTLMEAGADPDIQDKAGRTPRSLTSNNPEILRIFSCPRHAQATPDVQKSPVAQQGKTAVLPQEIVEQRGSSELNPVNSLHTAPRVAPTVPTASVVPPRISEMDIFQAASTGNIGRIEELLANGIDVNQQDNEGWTPLHYAVLYGHEAVVLRLIRAGADIDRKENAGGCTALHFAAISGYGEISLTLMEAGADPDIQDKAGRTPRSLTSNNPGISSIFSRPHQVQATPDSVQTHLVAQAEEMDARRPRQTV